MKVAVAGAHGEIGLRLCARLAGRGDDVLGLIRNPDHAEKLRQAGTRPVVCDLETADDAAIADAVAGADVVVFAAGSGAGSGPARKLSMDRDGAIALLRASGDARYVMVSAVGAQDPPADDEVFSVYLRAKADADAAVIDSDREWSVLRPGPLKDSPGTGTVRLSLEPFREAVTRDDVAHVLAALVDGAAARRVLYLGGGETPVADAVASI